MKSHFTKPISKIILKLIVKIMYAQISNKDTLKAILKNKLSSNFTTKRTYCQTSRICLLPLPEAAESFTIENRWKTNREKKNRKIATVAAWYTFPRFHVFT